MILPTVGALARMAGVSKSKMLDAIAVLRKRDVLSSTPGHRVCVKRDGQRRDPPAPQPPPVPTTTSGPKTDLKLWQRVESRIQTEILNGAFEDGEPLPSYKDLQRTYSVTYPIMRKALSSLEGKGFLVSTRRGYTPRPFSVKTSTARVVFIVPGYPTSEIFLFDNPDSVLFHAVETACARAGVRLDILVVPLPGGGSIRYAEVDTGKPRSLTDTPETLGYLYPMEMVEPRHEEVFCQLHRFGKPVAIFNTLDEWHLPQFVRRSSHFKFFTMSGSVQAASQVGRYLLGLGHRSIAYVSPHHQSQWSKARLAGLQDVYDSAGGGARVRACCSDACAYPGDFLRRSRQRTEYADMKQSFGRWEASAREEYVHDVKPAMQRLLGYSFMDAEIRAEAKPLFRQALDDPACTAWVLANDAIAVMAKDYLKSQGAQVPGSISLIGFDDTIPAMKHRISSYNFNIPAVARAMVNHVVNHAWFRKQYRQQDIEIAGHIVERDSAQRCPESEHTNR